VGKKKKLINKLKQRPTDFTFGELTTLLAYFDYTIDHAGKTSGSAVRFINNKTKHILRIHKPHPENTLKAYVIQYILHELRKECVLE
jgi:hypothetical protein